MPNCIWCFKPIMHAHMDTAKFDTLTCRLEMLAYEKTINRFVIYIQNYKHANTKLKYYSKVIKQLEREYCVVPHVRYLRLKGKNTRSQKILTELIH